MTAQQIAAELAAHGIDVTKTPTPADLAKLDQMHADSAEDANRFVDEFVTPLLAEYGTYGAMVGAAHQLERDLFSDDGKVGFAALVCVLLAEARKGGA